MQSLKQLIKWFLAVVLLCFALADAEVAAAQDCYLFDEECEEQVNESEVEEEIAFGESPWLSFLKMIGALLLVVLLLVGLLKFVNKRARSFQETKAMSLVSGVSLGANRSVQLVKVGDKLLVVGVGESVQLLHTIEDQAEIEALLKKQQGNEDSQSVTDALGVMKASLFPNKKAQKQSFQDVLSSRLNDSKQELAKNRQLFQEKGNEHEWKP
ncbi:flagellar biosynthetic protein FliO [Shouchella xiaoxiensis]|nr:flagellar biosynthetic protein FliO [Shouchella xiaoxiensis]